MDIIAKYIFFALVATLINLLCQDLAGRVYEGPFELYFSMGIGTLAGLAVKYVLDKKFIFFYRAKGVGDDGRKFLLYSLMGVFTTLVFWGAEIGFDFLFTTRSMRYVGAVLGLSLGYWLKYRLDKRFVFVEVG